MDRAGRQRNSGTTYSLHCVRQAKAFWWQWAIMGPYKRRLPERFGPASLSGTSLALYGVAYSNGVYVAAGQEGTVVTSPDGVNWTVQDSGQLNNLMSVTYGSVGFLAVGDSGTILTSPDGVDWTAQTSGSSGALKPLPLAMVTISSRAPVLWFLHLGRCQLDVTRHRGDGRTNDLWLCIYQSTLRCGRFGGNNH